MGIGLALVIVAGIGVAAASAALITGQWAPPMSPEARAALDEADYYQAGIDAVKADLEAFPTDVAPYLPGPPSEYRHALAAGRADIRASEDYIDVLKDAAADGEITRQEQATITAARLRAENAEDAHYAAWLSTPAGPLLQFNDAMIAALAGALTSPENESERP